MHHHCPRGRDGARRAGGKLQQVLSQLNRAQPELLEFFELPSDESCHRIVELVPGEASEVASENAPQGAPPQLWCYNRPAPHVEVAGRTEGRMGPGMYATLQGTASQSSSVALCTLLATASPSRCFVRA